MNATCCICHRLSHTARPVRYIERASGPGHTLYACPSCAPTLARAATPQEAHQAR